MIAIFRHWHGFVILSITCLVIWAGIILGLGPRVEAAFFPPFSEISYLDVVRNGDMLCWTTHLQKVRPAMLVVSSYWLEHDRIRTPIAVLLNGEPGGRQAPIEPGPPINIGRYCAALPKVNGVDVAVSGSKIINVRIYDSAFCCWEFIYSFPPILIP